MKNMNLKKAMKIADSKMPSKYKVKDGFSNNPNYVGDWFGEGQIDFSAIINPEDDGDVYMVKLWCGSGYVLDVYLCKAHDIYEALDIVSEWSYKNEGANEIVFDYDYLLKDCERDYNSSWYGGKEPTPAEKGMDFDEFFDEWAESWLIMCENGYWVREENLFVDKVPDEYLVDNEPISDSRKRVKDNVDERKMTKVIKDFVKELEEMFPNKKFKITEYGITNGDSGLLAMPEISGCDAYIFGSEEDAENYVLDGYGADFCNGAAERDYWFRGLVGSGYSEEEANDILDRNDWQTVAESVLKSQGAEWFFGGYFGEVFYVDDYVIYF